MSKVFTGASMSLDGYISGPDETGFEHLFKWYGNGDVEVTTRESGADVPPVRGERGALPQPPRRDRSNRRRPQAVRLHGCLGWQAPAGPARGRRHPQRPGGLAARGLSLQLRHRRDRERDRAGQGARGRQGGRRQRRHDRLAVPRRPPARRDLGRSRPGPARRRDILLRPAAERSGRARGSDRSSRTPMSRTCATASATRDGAASPRWKLPVRCGSLHGRGRVRLRGELPLLAVSGGHRLGVQGLRRDRAGEARAHGGPEHVAIFGEEDANDTRCAVCGGFLFSVVRDGAFVHVAMGSLVDAPTIRPTNHIFVGSKAAWFEITDDLPQFDEHSS